VLVELELVRVDARVDLSVRMLRAGDGVSSREFCRDTGFGVSLLTVVVWMVQGFGYVVLLSSVLV